MIKSMTGFGEAELSLGSFRYRIEMRTLNNKFLDIRSKLPLELSKFDIEMQQNIKKTLARGRVDISFHRQDVETGTPKKIKIDWPLAEQYFKSYDELRERFSLHQGVSLMNLITAHGVVSAEQQEEDQETVRLRLFDTIGIILKSVIQMRKDEGVKLAEEMQQRAENLQKRVDKLSVVVPVVIENYKKRLQEKIQEITPQQLDEARLAQEVCYFADRCDITEEIVRLRAHTSQFVTFLNTDEPVGRKLDFLIQEMNREINTIGSKSSNTEVALDVVEVKSELEKLREQVQNVE